MFVMFMVELMNYFPKYLFMCLMFDLLIQIDINYLISILYKYDIGVGCTTGMTPPREDCCLNDSSRGSHSCCTPQVDVIFVLLYQTNTKHKRWNLDKLQRFWIYTPL